MTARTIHHHGTATGTGGTSAPSGGSSATSTGGLAAPFPIDGSVLTPIGGDPVAIGQVAAKYLAGAEQFRGAHAKVKGIHSSVFPQWEGAASREGERATTMAVGRAKYALDALTISGQALKVFATELAAAQASQTAAAAQVTTLQQQYTAQPLNAGLASELRTQVQKAQAAQNDAATARRKVEAALVHSSTVQWYTVPAFTARFDAVTAGILDSLVAHHWVSRANAQAMAGRLGKLSKADYAKFAKLEATATSDKERGKLYTELASGTPVSKIVAGDKKLHTPAPVHAAAKSRTGGTSSHGGGSSASGIAPAVVAPVAYRPSGGGSSSGSTPHKPPVQVAYTQDPKTYAQWKKDPHSIQGKLIYNGPSHTPTHTPTHTSAPAVSSYNHPNKVTIPCLQNTPQANASAEQHGLQQLSHARGFTDVTGDVNGKIVHKIYYTDNNGKFTARGTWTQK